ncbi:BamA/TamA family outer membrane protein [Fulvivirga sp. M361]|uniref:BamA/TamA family outer membrane protein n=1 Tax=Fulvivirga sp. M361 TaxID=2594266 RepID=UPI001628BDEA|nr:BamA/TamA family outer membrane protein [Fulvivirga sp. M361]
MNKTFYILTLVFVFFFLSPLFLTAQNGPTYTLYLIGDAGARTEGQTATFQVARRQMESTAGDMGLIFLGDNIYQKGMPLRGHLEREESEKVIEEHIKVAAGLKGDFYFIPGNHDWAQGRTYGWEQVKRQEAFVENYFDSTDVFLPSAGCPGPVEVSLNEEITLIILDTQWFLHGWDKPNKEQGSCDPAHPLEVLQALDNIMSRNAHKKMVVATHHPMYTYGSHGGRTKASIHVSPPVLGTVYALYRKAIGSVQDTSHPKYKAMRNALVSIFEKYDNVIHVAGHEHSLQYSFKEDTHYIVSGSGAKKTFVKKKGFAEYAESTNGLAKILFYADGKVDVEFWKSDGTRSFHKELMHKPYDPPLSKKEFVKEVDLSDSMVVASASAQYKAGKLKKKLLGTNYRDVWLQENKVPVFDIGNEHGGLEIVQRGGGMQTKSLRLEAENGKQYVLRSIEKYAAGAVPAMFQNTFAVDLVQDQISASHPYGAFVVPYLAKEAGIYHTNPKLVFIPDDPRFGEHQKDFANTLALYEERPAKDWSDADHFGNSEKIVNTAKVLEKLADDNDNFVDQEWVVKSRLFDLVIGDWDRHDDQWRWASFKESKKKIYRPIPRDRDQAFFVNTGLFPAIWSRKWGLPKFEGFDHEVRWPSGLMFNARYFDRSFLTGLSREDWIKAVEDLQTRLTDDVIEAAIKKWPEAIYKLHGDEITKKIKSRRDGLKQYALEHYEFLAKEVDVIGSNKHEHFKATRLPGGDVHVVVKKVAKDGDKKGVIYDRLFKHGETKEIRLYGLDGKDEFEIEGESNKSIRIRVIGGDDEDELDDDSRVAGLGKKTIFYDTKEGNKLKLNKESRNRLSTAPTVNAYDRKAFKYNILMPLVTAAFNPDDGIFIGGGFQYTHHGFRKKPFQSQHKLMASYAANTSSYNFEYQGAFTDVLGPWDLETFTDVRFPDFTNFFFGLGNESEFNQNIDQIRNVDKAIRFYRLRFEQLSYELGLFRPLGAFAKVGITHDFFQWELESFSDGDRFVQEFVAQNNLDIEEKSFTYLGGGIHLDVDTRKNKAMPTNGILWENKISTLWGINNDSDDFHQLNTSFSFYHSFRLPARLTFASRIGYGKNFGTVGEDYPFFLSQTLGGRANLRGYRITRFYGEQAFYNNFELRLKLFTFRTYLLPAAFGIMAFHDTGRVWLDGEDSDKWHRGVGGGLWFAPFNAAVISTEIGASEEDTLFYFRFGFLF